MKTRLFCFSLATPTNAACSTLPSSMLPLLFSITHKFQEPLRSCGHANPSFLVKHWRVIPVGLVLFAESACRNLALAGDKLSSSQHGDYVVLVHGLGRSSWSMKGLEWALARQGYRVINVSYPSTRLSIEDVAADWLTGLLQERTSDRAVKIHFVTHSLGGIVLRQYLSENEVENLGRVVMLAPPNRGSELADRLQHNYFYRFFTGPAGQQLGTGVSSLPNRLGPATFDLGVVAGDRSLNPCFSYWIPGPDDGKVSVRSTTLEGMQDFLLVHHSHTWMMWRRDVAAAVIRFLSGGCF